MLARPLSGFAETFSQYVVEVSPGGGSDQPEGDPAAEAVLFVVDGALALTVDGAEHALEPGFVRLPAARHALDAAQQRRGDRDVPLDPQGLPPGRGARRTCPRSSPASRTSTPIEMPGTDGAWSTTRFVDIADLRHDMHVNIVNFQPGGAIPFPETHVMEHGLYVLEGKAVYLLNEDWVEVEAGDFMWLRAFCPQACYAGGPGPFRYLLYKDVNRHVGATL